MKMNKVKLDDLVSIKTGRLNANAAEEDGKYPFFTTAKEVSRINSYSYEGEVVLVAGNGDLNVKYYDGKFDAYQRTYILSNKNNTKLDMKYLYYFMSRYVERLRNESIGGVIKYIKISNLTEAKVPLPDLSTQKRIISILEQAESIINERTNQLQELDSLIRSIFWEIFDSPKYNFSKPDTPLKEISKIVTGNTPPRKEKDNYGNYIEWLKTDNIIENIYPSQAQECLSKKGTKKGRVISESSIIMACIAGSKKSIGKVSIMNRKAAINQQINAITEIDSSVSHVYLYYYFLSQKRRLEDYATDSMKKMINKTRLSEFKITVPKEEDQIKFIKIVEEIESIKEKVEASLDEMNTLFDALMQKAFTGELI